jgi:hypothetical protein
MLHADHNFSLGHDWRVVWPAIRAVEDALLSTRDLSQEEQIAFKEVFERLCRKRGSFAVRPLFHLLANVRSGGYCNEHVMRISWRIIADCSDHLQLFGACENFNKKYGY